MAKMIQVRNVPDRLHREPVRRARLKSLTLTDNVQATAEVRSECRIDKTYQVP